MSERQFIEEQFVIAFAHSMMVEVPDQEVQDAFITFVVAKRKYAETKAKITDNFVRDCIPEFINKLYRGEINNG